MRPLAGMSTPDCKIIPETTFWIQRRKQVLCLSLTLAFHQYFQHLSLSIVNLDGTFLSFIFWTKTPYGKMSAVPNYGCRVYPTHLISSAQNRGAVFYAKLTPQNSSDFNSIWQLSSKDNWPRTNVLSFNCYFHLCNICK